MPAEVVDWNFLLRRIRVHELRERGVEVDVIAERTEVSKRCVQRYLRMPKPKLVRPKAAWGWQDEAACQGMSIHTFFPDKRGRRSCAMKAQALSVCAECPVKRDCLNNAIANFETFGVWGGVDFSLFVYAHDADTGEVSMVRRQTSEVA